MNTNLEVNNVSTKYNLIDMPEIINLPKYNIEEAVEVLKRLTTLMASV